MAVSIQGRDKFNIGCSLREKVAITQFINSIHPVASRLRILVVNVHPV
jgi:hypothetical protein